MSDTTPIAVEPYRYGPFQNAAVRRWAMLLVLLVASCFTAFSGNGTSLPLDEHDTLVARSAEEMIDRGEFMVPYLNGEVRLKKPPLQNWLALATHYAFRPDVEGEIDAWEARFPSGVAAVVLVLLAFGIGVALLDDITAFVGGLLILSSKDFVFYSHAARPEMLYAVLCTAQIYGWLLADRWLDTPSHASWARWATWLGWVAAGLAMLTKGPQLQLILTVGLALALWRLSGWRRALAVIRPFTGVAIFLAVSGWWYVVVLHSVEDASNIWQGEIAKRASSQGNNRWSYIDPYYFYRTVVLILPWVALYPLALAAPWMNRWKGSRGVKLLWSLLLAVMLLLHIAAWRRWYYMLPVMAPLGLLMAAGGIGLADAMRNRAQRVAWDIVIVGHAVALCGVIWWFRSTATPSRRPDLIDSVLIAIGAAALLAFLVWQAKRSRRVAWHGLALLALLGAAFMVTAEENHALWTADRFGRWRFAERVRDLTKDSPLLLSWNEKRELEEYSVKRRVNIVNSAATIDEVMGKSDSAWLLVSPYTKPQLPAGVEIDSARSVEYDEAPRGKGGSDIRLVYLRRSSSKPSPSAHENATP